MAVLTRYPTKPVECWGRAKELRRFYAKHVSEAHEKGELVIQGLLLEGFISLFGGFGNFADPGFGRHYTRLMKNIPELIKVYEAFEALGFGRDICASMRCHLGQLYTGLASQGPRGGTITPHLVFQGDYCYAATKTAQLYAEYYQVPVFTLDLPDRDTPHGREYLVAQMQDAISWVEKYTGRKNDDEKLMAAVANEWEVSTLWAQICELQKAVPAPLDDRMMRSLQIPRAIMRHRREAVDFYHTLLAEVKQRVEQGISARGREQARLTYEGMTPHYNPRFLRVPERYGAIYIGGSSYHMAVWDTAENGSWLPAPTPAERGMELKTREDALWALADYYIKYRPNICYALDKPHEYVQRARDWQADGVVIQLDHGCNGQTMGYQEVYLALQRAGIPAVTYEGSVADPRDFSEATALDRLEAFFEGLGLQKVEDTGKEGSGEDD